MTLEQFAYLAEIIGVIIVVVTLLYLTVQVRQGAILVAGLLLSTPTWSACPGDARVQLQILGSGGPAASSGRASASYMLWLDGVGRIMVDTGSGTKDQFHASGARLADIDLVAISHLHPDHSVELPGILWPGGGSFKVSGPSGAGPFLSIGDFLDRLFGADGIYGVLADRTEFDVITVEVTGDDPVEVWRDGNVLVRGIGVPHGNVPTVGYRVDVGDTSIAFSSDQNGSNPAYIDFIKDVDVLVIHLGGGENSAGNLANLHAKPSVWGQMAADANAGQVVVSHISNTSPNALEANLGYLRGNYDGPLVVAEDLMCVDIR